MSPTAATPLAHIPPHSHQSITRSPQSNQSHMKDLATTSLRHSRNSLIYPKKRPSPHGISKPQKSPLAPINGLPRKTPRSAKSTLLLQRQRQAHIIALRREGVFLEEEYRDEIRCYMHDMEVRLAQSDFSTIQLLISYRK